MIMWLVSFSACLLPPGGGASQPGQSDEASRPAAMIYSARLAATGPAMGPAAVVHGLLVYSARAAGMGPASRHTKHITQKLDRLSMSPKCSGLHLKDPLPGMRPCTGTPFTDSCFKKTTSTKSNKNDEKKENKNKTHNQIHNKGSCRLPCLARAYSPTTPCTKTPAAGPKPTVLTLVLSRPNNARDRSRNKNGQPTRAQIDRQYVNMNALTYSHEASKARMRDSMCSFNVPARAPKIRRFEKHRHVSLWPEQRSRA